MGHVASPTICDIVIFYLEQQNLLANDKIYKWLRFHDNVFSLYFGNMEEAT